MVIKFFSWLAHVLNGLFTDPTLVRAAGRCPRCRDPVDIATFKDRISGIEFKISGLCQKCQDKLFNQVTK